jgi:hypothetical protein
MPDPLGNRGHSGKLIVLPVLGGVQHDCRLAA